MHERRIITNVVWLQYAANCLDVALQLLQGLNADDRRSATTITKCIVAQVSRKRSLYSDFMSIFTVQVMRRSSGYSITYTVICIQVNSHDGKGVMSECYSGTYTGGMAPCRWNGSPSILQRFYRSQQPVRYVGWS